MPVLGGPEARIGKARGPYREGGKARGPYRRARGVRDEEMKLRRGQAHRAHIGKLGTPFPLPARPPAITSAPSAASAAPTRCCISRHTGQEAPRTKHTQSLGPAPDEVAPSYEVALRVSLPPPAAASAPRLAPAYLFPVARFPEALWSGGGPTAPTVADSHRLDTTEKAAGPRETACLRFSDERRADRRAPTGFALKVLRA